MAVPFLFLSALLAVGTSTPVTWSWGGPQAAALQREAVDVDMALAEAQQTPGYGGSTQMPALTYTATVTKYGTVTKLAIAIATAMSGQATVVIRPQVTNHVNMPVATTTVPFSGAPLGQQTQAPMSSPSPSPGSASPAGASTLMLTPSQSLVYPQPGSMQPASTKPSNTVATITATGTVQATATATISA